jgi:hypothetical protein
LNFFGHAALAARRSGSPGFVLGAMLPDLVAMIGLRLPTAAAGDGELGRGIALHHATDAAFHRDAGFVRLCTWALDELTAQGLSRGSARAVGHVGSELLLDGLLSHDARALAAYRDSIAEGSRLLAQAALRWRSLADEDELCAALERLAAAPLPEGYADPSFVAERLVRILSRRPRLALQPGDRAAVERWLCDAQPTVARDLGGVVDALDELIPYGAPRLVRRKLDAGCAR